MISKQSLSDFAKLTLIAAAISMAVGCSSDSDPAASTGTGTGTTTNTDTPTDTGTDTGTGTETPVSSTIIISDPYATACTVTYGTVTATEEAVGQYTIAVNLDGTFPLVAVNCVDSVTGVQLPTMKSDGNGNGGSEVMTPITTMLQALVEAGKSTADARALVVALFGLADEDLEKDPVTNPSVQKAAAKLVSLITMLAENGDDKDVAFGSFVSEVQKTEHGNKSLDELSANVTFIGNVAQSDAAKAKATDIAATLQIMMAQIVSIQNDSADAIRQLASLVKTLLETIAPGVQNGTFTALNVNTTVLVQLQNAVINFGNIIINPIDPVNPGTGTNTGTTTATSTSTPTSTSTATSTATSTNTGGGGSTVDTTDYVALGKQIVKNGNFSVTAWASACNAYATFAATYPNECSYAKATGATGVTGVGKF